jgi:hypothetical protein
MPDSHRYVMLIASLPYHGPLFGVRQTPLSRIRLDQRLSLLEPRDRDLLDRITDLLDWMRHGIGRSDADILANARDLLPRIASPTLKELVTRRLELRSLVAALRSHRQGEGPPGSDVAWGFGRWMHHIRANWSEPGFRLGHAYPQVHEMQQMLDSGDMLGFERLLLGMIWRDLARIEEGHRFDFEAVVIYTLRWDLVYRWTGYDGEDAVRRFDELTEQALSAVALAL